MIDLLMAMVVMGLLSLIAVPTYQNAVTRARIAQAIADISEIDGHIERYRSQHFRFPPTLGDLNTAIPLDPWGNAYAYLNIEAGVPQGMVRKDRNLNPLNSDYDLYSKGPDGETQTQLTASKARDDIIRAGNGGFIGLASDH